MVPQLLFTINVLRPTRVGVILLAAGPCHAEKQGIAMDLLLENLGLAAL